MASTLARVTVRPLLPAHPSHPLLSLHQCAHGLVYRPLLVGLSALFHCSLITVVITEPMKYLFGRQRPCEENISYRVVPIRKDLTNPAFPSGDSAQVGTVDSFDCRPL